MSKYNSYKNFAIYLSTDFVVIYLLNFGPLICFEIRAAVLMMGPPRYGFAFETRLPVIFKIRVQPSACLFGCGVW